MRDYEAAARFWSDTYIQHSDHIEPGREDYSTSSEACRTLSAMSPVLSWRRGLCDSPWLDEAVAKARKIRVAENVAILDDGGNLKAFGRMDGAPILCIEIAQNKAYTALFGVSTQDLFDFIQADPSLLAGMPMLARMRRGAEVSHYGERRSCRGDRGAGRRGAERRRLRESALALVPMRRRPSNEGATIMIHTHQSAPTQFVEANGIRFAYRRFGKLHGVPLVFNQHFTGTMDQWIRR